MMPRGQLVKPLLQRFSVEPRSACHSQRGKVIDWVVIRGHEDRIRPGALEKGKEFRDENAAKGNTPENNPLPASKKAVLSCAAKSWRSHKTIPVGEICLICPLKIGG